MIRTKDVNIISDMLKYAKKNKHYRVYTIVAFLVKGKNVVSIGINDYKKTHSNTPQIEDYIIPSHAEVRCVSKFLVKHKKITSDMTLYVVGLTMKKGDLVISSKPCESCQKYIKLARIPRVVYVENQNGFAKILEISF
jgi:tRNA(Arg) A34 adenosine deaminase TadA